MTSASEAPEFEVHRTETVDEIVLRLRGEFDLTGIDRFEEAAADLADRTPITVDLSELAFIDSSGLRALMNLELRSRSRGGHSTVTLRAPQPHVLRTLLVCGFDQRVTITEA